MKPVCTQQEIILITSSTFSQRELYNETDQNENKPPKTAREQLKEACWNGLVAEILPEIFPEPGLNKELFLWNIYDGDSFIGLELAAYETKPDWTYSINPERFLSRAEFN